MFPLAVPWILLLLALIAVILFILKKRIIAICLVVVVVLLNLWADCYNVGFKSDFGGDVVVLSYNVAGSNGYDKKRVNDIFALVIDKDPDIVFFTEYFRDFGDSLHVLLKKNYIYNTRELYSHNVIYSNYPISNITRIEGDNAHTSFIVGCSIQIGENLVKVIGCHLSSNNYSSDLDYLTPSDISSTSGVWTYITNMEKASSLRKHEAISILKTIQPKDNVIIMGDMNDVSGSPTMNIFKDSGFIDAWSRGGLGYGATIHNPIPYRIDHILYRGLKIKGIGKSNVKGLSDHDALFACFEF